MRPKDHPVEPESVRHVHDGTFIRLDVESWPDTQRDVVRHPGSCAVVAFTPAGQVVLIRQFREAVRRPLLEVPAGIRDEPGEDAADCAARELLEETGYRLTRIESLGRFHASPGMTDEVFELFVGDAESDREPGEKDLEVVSIPLDEAVAAVRRGEISDAKTALALLLARDRPGYAGSRPVAEEP